jgi:hypothetical protein
LGAASVAELSCAGPAGTGLFAVCGTRKDGAGVLDLFAFESVSDEIADQGLAEQLVFRHSVVLAGDYAGEFPIAVLPLHGVPDHAMVLTSPGGWLLDVDLSQEGPDPARLLQEQPLPAHWDHPASKGLHFETALHRRYGAKYSFHWDGNPWIFGKPIVENTFVSRAYNGNLEGHLWDIPQADLFDLHGVKWAWPGQSFPAFVAESRKLQGDTVEVRGVRQNPQPEGDLQHSLRVENHDLLRTRDGAFAEVSVQRSPGAPDSIVLAWHRQHGPLRSGELFGRIDATRFDVQRLELKADVTTVGVVGPGLLLVSTFNRHTNINRLELFEVRAPLLVDARQAVGELAGERVPFVGYREMLYHEPRHLRTVHASHLFVKQGAIAILENRNRPMSAFVLLRYSSALCEVDLSQDFGDLQLLISAEQQPVLSDSLTRVYTMKYEGVGYVYAFLDYRGDLFGCDSSGVQFVFVDTDADGTPDGNGFGSDKMDEYGALLNETGTGSSAQLLEFAGQTVGN